MNVTRTITALKTENIVTQSDKPLYATRSSNDSDIKNTFPHNAMAFQLSLSENTGNGTGTLTQELVDTQNHISLIQTADEALNKIHSMLQQGKELTLQAQTAQDAKTKQALQSEIDKLNQDIDDISASTQYGNLALFENNSTPGQDAKDIIYALKSSWLEQAEKVVQTRYGLTGDGSNLSIVLDHGHQSYLAAVYYNYDDNGKAANQSLHIAVKTALPAKLPNGGKDPAQYDDRVIAHEMVHAIMGRAIKVEGLPNWFQEGTAEFIHGPNERVFTDLSRNGGGIKGATKIQDALGDGTNGTWKNNSLHYSAASMAVRYLHEKIKANGHQNGIRDLLADLKNNPTENLDQALSHVSSYQSVDAFVNDFVDNGNGAKFIHNLDRYGEFRNAEFGGDTGAISGANADGGSVLDAESVIPDRINTTDTPLKYFHVIWPDDGQNYPISDTTSKKTQSNTYNNTLGYTSFKVNSNFLNTNRVNLVKDPAEGKAIFDRAISYVSQQQNHLTGVQDKLHKQANTINATIGRSNIPDSTAIKSTMEDIKTTFDKQGSFVISSITRPRPEKVYDMLKLN